MAQSLPVSISLGGPSSILFTKHGLFHIPESCLPSLKSQALTPSGGSGRHLHLSQTVSGTHPMSAAAPHARNETLVCPPGNWILDQLEEPWQVEEISSQYMQATSNNAWHTVNTQYISVTSVIQTPVKYYLLGDVP